MKHDELDEWFAEQQEDWDIESPATGHKARFMARLSHDVHKKSVANNKDWWKWLAVAASFTILFGFILSQKHIPTARDLADISPKMQQTQDFFTASIAKDLERLKNESSPDDQKLVNDALNQLEKLEADYHKLKEELVKSGENKRVIHAMITNFQTRITLLNDVLEQLNKTNSIKINDYENNIL